MRRANQKARMIGAAALLAASAMLLASCSYSAPAASQASSSASSVAGASAAGVHTAITPGNDKRNIRCYYRADLTTTYPVKEDPKVTMPPYITTGIYVTGFDAKNNPNPGDPNAGMQQVADPILQCSRSWDLGTMNPQGITDDLIPPGFVQTTPAADPSKSSDSGMPSGKYGNPLGGPAGPNKLIGHYVPQLTACVVDNSVAVIPGGPDICAHLGIPTLEQ